MDITQENMASVFRFFMTYNELCKSFSNIDLENMYYLDLRVDCKSRYIGNIYTQFSDIPDFENCMYINIAVALLNQKIIVASIYYLFNNIWLQRCFIGNSLD